MDASHTLKIPDQLHFSLAKQVNANCGKTHILGTSRLQEIWGDMEKTILPSWCKPVPPRIGDKGHGKISADGWQVFCTVHLILTLGRLWGPMPPESCKNRLFMNFCDLVAVTRIANGRHITVVCTNEFRDLMLRYLHGLNELFPTQQFIPYHCISLHLTELLSHFGLITVWCCWVFERYNHMVHNIETNRRFCSYILHREW